MNVLIHGFNVSDPEDTIGKLAYYIDKPTRFNYGWFGLLSVLLYNKREAKKLKEYLEYGDRNTIYAHSNGCAIAVLAAEMGAKIDKLVCINPALKVDAHFPESINDVLVICNRGDNATKAARFANKIPFLGLFVSNSWGAMGAYGAENTSDRVTNMRLDSYMSGHSEFFKSKHLSFHMPKVLEWVNG